MAKEVKTIIKLQVPAGKANPGQQIGTALGPHGLNMMDFCNQFNERTRELGNAIIPVEITVYVDRTFDFITKQPPAAFLIKEAAKIQKGTSTPGKDWIGTISKDKLREIAEKKMPDLNANDVDAAMKIMAGAARSMGIKVEE